MTENAPTTGLFAWHHAQTEAEQKLPGHQAQVLWQPEGGHGYSYRPSCTCNWEYSTRFMTSAAARGIAEEHVAMSTVSVVEWAGPYRVLRRGPIRESVFAVVNIDVEPPLFESGWLTNFEDARARMVDLLERDDRRARDESWESSTGSRPPTERETALSVTFGLRYGMDASDEEYPRDGLDQAKARAQIAEESEDA